MRNQFVFVYGSLKHGFPLAGNLAGCTWVGNGKLEGASLLSLGAYPALIFNRCATGVQGEIYLLPADREEEMLEWLDAIESEGILYKRVQVDVELLTEPLRCWVYVYMPMINQEFVENGNWEGGA